MSDSLSLKEMESGGLAPKGDSAPPDHLTLSDLDPSYKPKTPPGPGILSNNPAGDSGGAVAAKGISTAMIKLLSQIPGFYGNLNEGAKQLGAAAPAGYNALFNNQNFGQDFDRQIKAFDQAHESAKAAEDKVAQFPMNVLPDPEDWLPSADSIQNLIFHGKLNLPGKDAPKFDDLPSLGEYKPQGLPGELGMATAEGVGASIFPGGAATKVNKAGQALDFTATQLPKVKAYVANLISGGAGDAGADATGQITDNPWLKGLGGLVSSITPSWLSHAATGRTLGTAERLSGQAMRDAVVDPAATQAALETIPAAPIPGAKLTSAQVARDPGLAAIETSMAQKTRNEGTFAGEIAQDNADSGAALETAAGKAAKQSAKKPWVEANLGSSSPEETSVKARDIFSKAEEAADNAQGAAWSDPSLNGALMHKNKTLNRLREAISDMPVTDQEVVGNMYGKILDKIDDTYDNQVPMKELQSLRSSIRSDQRSMGTGTSPNYNGARVMGKLAQSVNDVLSEDKNYFYRPKGFDNAYTAAKQSTADYYKTFGPMKDLLASSAPGVDKVASEATLSKLMRGDNAPQNVRQFRAAVGPSADDLLSDYVVSDVTGHGMKLPQPDQVEKYMVDNAGKIAEIPGLDARLNGLKSASRSDLVSQVISQHAANPDKLFDFLDANKGDVNAVFSTPQQKDLIDGIKDASRRLSKIPEGEIGTKETFNKVTNGRVLDVLLGSAAAHAITAGTGAAVGHAVASHIPEAAGWAEGVGALFGGHSDKINELARKALLGDNQDRVKELLQEGLRDPKVGAMLMKKADPDNLAILFQKVNPSVSGVASQVAKPAPSQPYARGGQVKLQKSRALLRRATAPLPAY